MDSRGQKRRFSSFYKIESQSIPFLIPWLIEIDWISKLKSIL
jgi:hypothetical protein